MRAARLAVCESRCKRVRVMPPLPALALALPHATRRGLLFAGAGLRSRRAHFHELCEIGPKLCGRNAGSFGHRFDLPLCDLARAGFPARDGGSRDAKLAREHFLREVVLLAVDAKGRDMSVGVHTHY